MALLKTTDELKNYVAVDVNMQHTSLEPYLQQGKSQVVRLLGKTLYNALDVYHNNSEATEVPAYDSLIPYVQRCLANFAMYYGLSALNVSIGPNGIGVVSTDHVAPASKDRTDALKSDILNAAWDAMEEMLEFLEENIDDYSAWESSDAYAMQYDTIITSARKFDELLRIDRSRLKYLEWKPTMRDVELLVLAPQVGSDFLSELKTQIAAGSLTVANIAVLTHLQKALAYITRSQMMDENKNDFERTGLNYLTGAKKIMDDSIVEYPTYAASDAYDAVTSYKRYENDEDSKFFVTGI